jgi:hypothetical protein
MPFQTGKGGDTAMNPEKKSLLSIQPWIGGSDPQTVHDGGSYMRITILLLSVITLSAFAADRVVLVEDFTNDECSFCWNIESQVNAFASSHIAAGEIAMIRVHVSWPGDSDPIYLANPTEQNARKSFYNVTGVPTIKFDGVITGTSNLEGSYTTRAAVPSYLDILVCRNGSDMTGTMSIRLIAEQDLDAQAPLRLFCTLVEDNVPGTGYWSGTVFMQAFRDNLFGPVGPVVAFAAPYPDTLFFEAPYNTAGWSTANLSVATFLQEYSSGNKEVMNASYGSFLGLQTGIGEGALPEAAAAIRLDANPCHGCFAGTVTIPGGSGVIDAFDLAGRRILSIDVGDGSSIEGELPEAGLYMLRLRTADGSCSTQTLISI